MILVLLPLVAEAGPVGRCVNLSNDLDAPTGEVWGPVITPAHLDAIAAAGFDAVRLPVRFSEGWDGHVDPERLARADLLVDAALERGLTVIIDLHHFEEIMADPDGQADTFVAIWTELSAHWRGAPDTVIFELLNEPSGALTTDRVVALYDRVIPIIRRDHPDRWIVLEGGDWASAAALSALPRPDDRILHSFHYYSPFEVTHQLAPWAADDPMPARKWTVAEGGAAVSRDLDAAARATDAPILLGEFGVYREADIATREAWTTHVRTEAERRDMGWCVWGFAADFRIYDADTDSFLPELLRALLGSTTP